MSTRTIGQFIKNQTNAFQGGVFDLFVELGLHTFFSEMKNNLVMKIHSPVSKQLSFLEVLNEWLSDGTNPVVAIKKMRESALRAKRKDKFNIRAATSILTVMENGQPLSEGMKGIFSPEIIDLFNVGEQTSTLDIMLRDYLKHLQEKRELQQGALKRLLYPFAMILMVFSLMVVIHEKGVPYLLSMNLDVSKARGLTKALFDTSSIAATLSPYITTIFTFAWVFYSVSKNNYVGKKSWLPSRNFLDRIVPFSIFKQFVAMGIIKNVALLSKTGLSMKVIITILSRHASPYERYYYDKIRANVSNKTGTIATYMDVDLLADDLFQKLDSLAAQKGEQAKLKALDISGKRSGQSAKNKINTLLQIIVPLAWVVMVGMTMLVVLGVIGFASGAKAMLINI
jgi:type II secretory pathway component PulF